MTPDWHQKETGADAVGPNFIFSAIPLLHCPNPTVTIGSYNAEYVT